MSGPRREAWIGGSEGYVVGGLLGSAANGSINEADEVMFRVHTEAGISSKARRDIELSYNAIRGLVESRQIAGPDFYHRSRWLNWRTWQQGMADEATNGFFLGFIHALQVSADPLGNRQVRVSIPTPRVGGPPDVQLGFMTSPKAAKALRVNRPKFAESPNQPFSMWRNRPADPGNMFHGWAPWDDVQWGLNPVERWLDHTQTILDFAGLASMSPHPLGQAVGMAADGLNALIYIGRWKLWDAGTSLAGFVPVLGDGAVLKRIAGRAASWAADGLAAAAREVRALGGDFARGFSRGTVRSRNYLFSGMGPLLPVGDGIAAAVAGAQARRGKAIPNKIAGDLREVDELAELQSLYPNASVQRERYLRTATGERALDPLTGTARRIDFAIIENGKVIDLIEKTSELADKAGQIAKEGRIRQSGGTFVRDKVTRELLDVSGVPTRITRRR